MGQPVDVSTHWHLGVLTGSNEGYLHQILLGGTKSFDCLCLHIIFFFYHMLRLYGKQTSGTEGTMGILFIVVYLICDG